MNDVSALIADMVRAGVDPELIGRTAAALAEREPVKITDDQAERRRAKDRERKRLRNSAESADSVPLSSPSGSPPTPPSPNPLQSIPPSPPKGGSSPADFETFWAEYPHKVGKRDAEKAFAKASRRIDLAALMAGLRRYAAKTDDRPWCNPSTWLNQDRWTDMPAAQPVPHRQSQAPPQKSAFHQRQDSIYQQLKRETGDPDDQFTGTTLDIGSRDYRAR